MGGRGRREVVEKLGPYLLGWQAYFGRAQKPKAWRGLDGWLRHCLRAILTPNARTARCAPAGRVVWQGRSR
ncbi:group II intron maturase-specific domain-containing protein [Hydrogenophaga sp.]|uniref:group II intron maturase-specific domain-containing protein n=1 Tax=Hydrogenophaga sp. TaxID=1904254 RepID=UPI003F6D4E8E